MNLLLETHHTRGNHSPKNIEDVINAIGTIINFCQEEGSSLGYFPTLYLRISQQVKQGIQHQIFEDNQRMARLYVCFASRYIDAFYEYQAGMQPMSSWRQVFDLKDNIWPTTLQHLLFAMHVHVNIDLGASAAEVMRDEDIQDLKADFDKLSNILGQSIKELVQDSVKKWPKLMQMLKIFGHDKLFLTDIDTQFIGKQAWYFALKLIQSDEPQLLLMNRDRYVKYLGKLIIHPPLVVQLSFILMRLSQGGSVADKINHLGNNYPIGRLGNSTL